MCECCENTGSKSCKIVQKHHSIEIDKNGKAKFFTA